MDMAGLGPERQFRHTFRVHGVKARTGTLLPIVVMLMMLASSARSHRIDSGREVILERHARAFPYTSVGYLRTQTTPYHYAPTASLLDQHERTYPKMKLGHVNTDREISEIIDLLDSVGEEEDSQGGESSTTKVDRERRAAPMLKRYACRFKFCRIFDV